MPCSVYDIDDRGRRVEDRVGIGQVDAPHALLDAAFILPLRAAGDRNDGRIGAVSVRIRDETGRCLREAVAAIDHE